MSSGPGLIFHIQSAIHEGATEEEIMEVIFLSAYEQCKCNVAMAAQGLAEGFKRAAAMKKS